MMGIQGMKWSERKSKSDYEKQVEALREMARKLKQAAQQSAEGS